MQMTSDTAHANTMGGWTNHRYTITYTLISDDRRHTIDTDSVGNRFQAFAKAIRNMQRDGHVSDVRVTVLPNIRTVSLRKDSPTQAHSRLDAAARHSVRETYLDSLPRLELKRQPWHARGPLVVLPAGSRWDLPFLVSARG